MRTRSSVKNKINVITLGCSKNVYDSEVLIGQLKANKKNVVHEKNGNIVVALLNGEFTVKKLLMINGKLSLVSENENYKPF